MPWQFHSPKGFQSCRMFYVKRVWKGLSLFFVEKVIWKFHCSNTNTSSHSVEPQLRSFCFKDDWKPKGALLPLRKMKHHLCVQTGVCTSENFVIQDSHMWRQRCLCPKWWILGLNHSDVGAKFTMSSMRIRPSTGPTLQGYRGGGRSNMVIHPDSRFVLLWSYLFFLVSPLFSYSASS